MHLLSWVGVHWPLWRKKMEEDEFVYDRSQSYETNFTRWYNMNCDERSDYNERLYTEEEGKAVFKEFIKHKNVR